MEFRMAMWLLTTLGIGTVTFLWHQRKSGESERLGASFSNSTIYFDPIAGEGHLFFGGMMVVISFSQFCYELAKILVSIAQF